MIDHNITPVRLTQYSHGAGCGCKISPMVLDEILAGNLTMPDNDKLIVGNHSKDDAAVYDIGNGKALISTTDFFMPIVDDPFEFGRIASANAISDVYAMGGQPILAIAILGWPINVLPPAVAKLVIDGSRSICREAGIPLAGGHSIDSPEPIFGLAVNGKVDIPNIKQNSTAKSGDILFLTKPLGVGILTTAQKKGLLQEEHSRLAPEQMMQLNIVGTALGKLSSVHAMTDVTGFGVFGHLVEMCEGSGLSAEINFSSIPMITDSLSDYIKLECVPGGTNRNWSSYGEKIMINADLDASFAKAVLADPQTSGGLLIAVAPDAANEVSALLAAKNVYGSPVGRMVAQGKTIVTVSGITDYHGF